jgi:hypothetical protein
MNPFQLPQRKGFIMQLEPFEEKQSHTKSDGVIAVRASDIPVRAWTPKKKKVYPRILLELLASQKPLLTEQQAWTAIVRKAKQINPSFHARYLRRTRAMAAERGTLWVTYPSHSPIRPEFHEVLSQAVSNTGLDVRKIEWQSYEDFEGAMRDERVNGHNTKNLDFTLDEADLPDDGDGLKLVRMSKVVARPPRFLIPPYFPRGCVTLFVGDPGTGKSLAVLSLLAHLTTGRPILGVKLRMDAMFLSNEDPSGISSWRFKQAGGDASRVMMESFNGKLFTLDQVEALENAIRSHKPGIIVIDSIMSHLGGTLDSYRANEVAAVLTPLSGIAEKYDTVIVGLMHMNKKEASRVLYRVQASIGFTAAARSVLALDYDPENPDGRILCHIKSNNAAMGPSQSLSVSNGIVTWNGESELRAGDLFGNEQSGDDKRELDAAKKFLITTLADGPMPSKEVYESAKAQDIAERTLRRAKQALNITSKKTKSGKWVTVMPSKKAKGES